MNWKILSIFLIMLSSKTLAYDHKIVHRHLNANASKQSQNISNALSYVKLINTNQLLEQIIVSGKSITDWFREGGTKEDNFPRSINHFHDPNRNRDDAGLKGLFYSGMSSVKWAQSYRNNWSWQNARDDYYDALSAQTKEDRDEAFADTFRAVGQVMHLLEDAASPPHTRNDPHPLPLFDEEDDFLPQIGKWTYETWCKHNLDKLNLSPEDPPLDIKTYQPVDGLAPITSLWDTTPGAGENINPLGLAEYTNRNFFSLSTVFKDYPHPQANDFYVDSIPENGEIKDRVYFKGTTTDGKTINHLASTGYLYQDLINALPNGLDDGRFTLDDECFKDYAAILVPKAVGYAAALLDYFFRGDIDWKPDGSDYTIINNSDETMNGTFTLYYDDKDGKRKRVPKAEWTRTLAAGATSAPLTVEVPDDADPDGQFVLAFRGELGNEEDAVVGRVVEMKKTIAARVASVSPGSSYSDPGVIQVRTEGGLQLRSALPDRALIRKAKAVRFDIEDWNRFVVLAEYQRGSSRVWEFHEYEVDVDNARVTYIGKTKQRTRVYSETETILHETLDHGYCNSFEKEDEGAYFRSAVSDTHQERSSVVDFLFQSGKIEDFYDLSISDVSAFHQYMIYFCDGSFGPNKWHDGASGTLESEYQQQVFFGDRQIDGVVTQCTGGEYAIVAPYESVYEVTRCADIDDNSNTRFYPKYVINLKDIIYEKRENNGSRKTIASFPLSASPYSGKIAQSLVTNSDNWVSFYTEESYRHYGSWRWRSKDSFSSEHGWLGCGNILLSEQKIGDRHLGWHKYYGLILFKSCSDYQKLNLGKGFFSIESEAIFDIFIK